MKHKTQNLKPELSHYFRHFALLFFPSIILLFIVIAFYFNNSWQSQKKLVFVEESRYVRMHQELTVSHLQSLISNLLFMANHESIKIFTENKSDLSPLENNFSDFCKYFSTFSKVRIIKSDGQEVIRVDKVDDGARIMKKNGLQQKAHRYYFQRTIGLDKSEVFFSPLDLNLEHGEISIPFKPVIRAATPLFNSKGNKKGIIVLTFEADKILSQLKYSTAPYQCRMLMTNRDGYWLIGPDPEDEWGFMFPDRSDRTFQKTYPEAWQKMEGMSEGQVLTKSGLFTFAEVHPFHQDESHHSFQNAQRVWTIISFLPAEKLAGIRNAMAAKFFLIGGILTFILGSIFAWISYVLGKRQLAERKAKAIFNVLEAMIQSSPLAMITFNSDDIITRWNPAAERMFGWSANEMIGVTSHIIPDQWTDKITDVLEKVKSNGEKADLELPLLTKSGEGFDGHVWLRTFKTDSDTTNDSIVAVFADVTAQKRAREIEKETESLNTARKMARTVAHEFRQPMTAISLISDLVMMRVNEPEKVTDYIHRLPSMVERMNDLVDHLLNITELKTKPYTRNIDIIDLENSESEKDTITLFPRNKPIITVKKKPKDVEYA